MQPSLLLLPFALLAPGQSDDAELGRLYVLNKSEATMSIVLAESGETEDFWPTGDGPHEIAISPDGNTAVVCDYGQQTAGNTLTVFDLTGLEAPDTIDLGEYRRPHGIQFEDSEHVIVTVEQNRALVRVNIRSGKVVASMPTEQDVSHMLVLTPDRSRAFVANIGSGTCTAIDLASGEILGQIETGAGAEGIDVTPDGKEVWVTNRSADTVSVIDAKSLAILATIPCATFPIRVKITPNGKHALVSNAETGDVAVIDVATRKELRRISMEISASETDGRLFGDQFGESPVPIGILIRPDGKRAFVANTNADLVTVLDLETWTIAGRLETGKQPDGLGWSSSTPTD